MTLFIVAFGLCLVVMPYAETFRYGVANFFLARPAMLFTLGIGVFSAGIFLMVGFFFMHKKRYYKVRMQCGKVEIEESIIQEYVASYWKSIFPDLAYELEVTLGQSQKIEIVTKFPSGRKDDQELFDRIKNELGVLLARRLGYEKEFILTITD